MRWSKAILFFFFFFIYIYIFVDNNKKKLLPALSFKYDCEKLQKHPWLRYKYHWWYVTLHNKLVLGQCEILRNDLNINLWRGDTAADRGCVNFLCVRRGRCSIVLTCDEQMLSEANEVNSAYPHVTPCTCKYFVLYTHTYTHSQAATAALFSFNHTKAVTSSWKLFFSRVWPLTWNDLLFMRVSLHKTLLNITARAFTFWGKHLKNIILCDPSVWSLGRLPFVYFPDLIPLSLFTWLG